MYRIEKQLKQTGTWYSCGTFMNVQQVAEMIWYLGRDSNVSDYKVIEICSVEKE